MRKYSIITRVVALYICFALIALGSFPGWIGAGRAYASDTVSRLVLSSNQVTVTVDESKSLTATAIYESTLTSDVTTSTDWSSGDSAIASVYNGTILGKKEGTTTVTATYSGKTVVVTVTVKKKVRSLTKNKSEVNMRIGNTEQINLTATYSDNTTENVNSSEGTEWNVADDSIATVYNGLITAVSSGTTTVTAEYGDKSVSVVVNVDIARRLDPSADEVSLRIGETKDVTLTAIFEDGSSEDVADKAEWTSSDGTVADYVDGAIKAYGSGQTTLTAEYGGQTATIVVSVELANRLEASVSDVFMNVDGSQDVKLTATFSDGTTEDVTADADWTSADESVAYVEDGKIFGYSVGQTTIAAEYGTRTVMITVDVGTPRKLSASGKSFSLHAGDTETVAITATYSDGTTADVTNDAEWSSDNEDVAYAKDGKIYALSAGEATITAELGGKTVAIDVDVDTTRSLKASQEELSLKSGASQQITLTVTYTDGTTKDVTSDAVWTADDSSVVNVNKGSITALKPGQATVTAEYEGSSATVTVQVDSVKQLSVDQTDLFLSKGGSQQLSLTATYNDGTTADVTNEATWTLTSEDIAYVVNGKITGSTTGQTTITAAYGGKTVTVTVDVAVARQLTLSKKTVSLRSGETDTLTLTATYADGTKEEVTSSAAWTTSNEDVAFAKNGTVYGYSAGQATVSAAYGGKTTTATVNVDSTTSLKASSDKLTLQEGAYGQVSLTAAYEDGTTADVTSLATWSTANSDVATVQFGKIAGVSQGATKVTAAYGTSTATITVSVGEMSRLAISESKLAMDDGDTKQVEVTVYFKDGTSKVVTDDATWTSSSEKVAQVAGGYIIAGDSGTATVTASYGDMKATVTVEVNVAAALTSTDHMVIMKVGDTYQLQLTMEDSDGDEKDVTNEAEWSVSSSKIADISTDGLVTAYAQGKTTITAKYGGKTKTFALEVDVATKIVLSQKTLQMKTGESKALTLTAYFSDGSTRDVTEEADWTSSKVTVADVTSGTVTASDSGKATIRAKFGGKLVTLPVEVNKLKYLKVNLKRVELTAGSTQQVTLTATYADGTEGDVTTAALWTSSNENTADVKDGTITAVYKGTTRVKAKFAGKTATVTVIVSQ